MTAQFIYLTAGNVQPLPTDAASRLAQRVAASLQRWAVHHGERLATTRTP